MTNSEREAQLQEILVEKNRLLIDYFETARFLNVDVSESKAKSLSDEREKARNELISFLAAQNKIASAPVKKPAPAAVKP